MLIVGHREVILDSGCLHFGELDHGLLTVLAYQGERKGSFSVFENLWDEGSLEAAGHVSSDRERVLIYLFNCIVEVEVWVVLVVPTDFNVQKEFTLLN